MIIQAGFTGKYFLDSQRTGHAKSDAADLVDPALFRHDIHQFSTGFPGDVPGSIENEKSHHEATPVVGTGKVLGIVDGEANRREGDDPGDNFNSVMMCVGNQRFTPELSPVGEFLLIDAQALATIGTSIGHTANKSGLCDVTFMECSD